MIEWTCPLELKLVRRSTGIGDVDLCPFLVRIRDFCKELHVH